MAMGTTTARVRVGEIHSGKLGQFTERPARLIPHVGRQLVAVCHEGEGGKCWSLTHVASGYALLFGDSYARVAACGQWFWATLSAEDKALFTDNAEIGEFMVSGDRVTRRRIAEIGHEMLRFHQSDMKTDEILRVARCRRAIRLAADTQSV